MISFLFTLFNLLAFKDYHNYSFLFFFIAYSSEKSMDPDHNLFFVAFLVLCLATNGVSGYATVTGTVFCDQCKDGERSLFDFPVSGNNNIFTLYFFFFLMLSLFALKDGFDFLQESRLVSHVLMEMDKFICQEKRLLIGLEDM